MASASRPRHITKYIYNSTHWKPKLTTIIHTKPNPILKHPTQNITPFPHIFTPTLKSTLSKHHVEKKEKTKTLNLYYLTTQQTSNTQQKPHILNKYTPKTNSHPPLHLGNLETQQTPYLTLSP